MTYNTHGPKHAVIDKQPSLFRKPNLVFLLGHALHSGKWGQNVLHKASSQKCEENNAKGDEIKIVGADCILTGLTMVVGKLEILVGVRSSFRNKVVAKE